MTKSGRDGQRAGGRAAAGSGAGAVRGGLLYLGSVVVDVMLAVPALPARGGDVLATAGWSRAGGGFNAMVAAARQGLAVRYAGAHGTGPFAALARAELEQAGIGILQPATAGQDTGFVLVLTEPSGERTFLTSPGAETGLGGPALAAVTPAPAEAVCVSGYALARPGGAALADWVTRLGPGHQVFFDPGPLAAAIPDEVLAPVLARTDWLTCNAAEAQALTGAREPATALTALTGRLTGPGRAPGGVVVRTGPDGCLVGRDTAAPAVVPGFPVEVADTNGAGDAHTGTLIAALARGGTPAAAARLANAAAALSVTRPGPGTAPGAAELARFLADTTPAG
jgi:sugar/nucleoside kinase (ribokinase family)